MSKAIGWLAVVWIALGAVARGGAPNFSEMPADAAWYAYFDLEAARSSATGKDLLMAASLHEGFAERIATIEKELEVSLPRDTRSVTAFGKQDDGEGAVVWVHFESPQVAEKIAMSITRGKGYAAVRHGSRVIHHWMLANEEAIRVLNDDPTPPRELAAFATQIEDGSLMTSTSLQSLIWAIDAQSQATPTLATTDRVKTLAAFGAGTLFAGDFSLVEAPANPLTPANLRLRLDAEGNAAHLSCEMKMRTAAAASGIQAMLTPIGLVAFAQSAQAAEEQAKKAAGDKPVDAGQSQLTFALDFSSDGGSDMSIDELMKSIKVSVEDFRVRVDLVGYLNVATEGRNIRVGISSRPKATVASAPKDAKRE